MNEVKKANITTRIMPCGCRNEGQDAIYGKGRRVFNAVNGNKTRVLNTWRCTVCGTVTKL